MQSARRINELISRHTTQWFHRINRDEVSPAISLLEITTRILEFMDARKLSLTVSEETFRKYMCEFLCTYYIAQKRQISWRGPLTAKPRPRGWTDKHEQQWEDYLRFTHFSSDYWNAFWDYTPEALWESRVPGWRDHLEYIVMHYVVVQPHKIELPVDSNAYTGDAYEEDGAYVGSAGSDEERY